MPMIRVGEGHYSSMNSIPPEHKDAIQAVLHRMRKVTHKLSINGASGEVELLSWDHLIREQADGR